MVIQRLNPRPLRSTASSTQAVRAGDTVYISSQAPIDANGTVVGVADVDAQAKQIFGSLKVAVESAGGAMSDLVKITAYLARPEYFAAIARARELYLPVREGARPAASTTVTVPALIETNALMEVEAIAVVGETGKSHRSIDPEKLPRTPGHPHGVVVGNTVYATGVMSRRYGQILGKGDAAIQARLAFDQMEYVLETVGASLADVVRHTTFYTHPAYYEPVRRVQEEIYGETPPAGGSVSVFSMGSGPDPVVEIEAIAVIGGVRRHLSPSSIKAQDGYSTVVLAESTAYISGQIAADPNGVITGKGDIDVQLAAVYANLDAALAAAGLNRGSMVKTTTYITRTDYAPQTRQAQQEFFGSLPPAATTVVVQGLPNPDCLVEIEGIAVID